MTSAALATGCALLAFSPSASLLFLIAYQKAQLIIVITTSAFFFLLSTLFTSLLWLPLPSSFQSNNNGVVLIVLGVVFQFLFRCAFVHVYHRVEHVIEISIKKHERLERQEEEERQRREQQQEEEERLRNTAAAAIINGNIASVSNGNGNLHHRNVSNTSADNNTSTSSTRQTPTQPSSSSSPPPPTTATTTTTTAISETARLRLELNDVSCGIAAGTGYGGMHAILLYGTLLASESGNVGTLYQPSCGSYMPSLVHSAITAFFFGVLDVIWMLFAFYGVRRVKYTPVMEQQGELAGSMSFGTCLSFWNRLYPNTKQGGIMALFTALASHFGAGLATLFNSREDGCVVSLSVLGGVVIVTLVLFWLGISNHYLPENQRRRLLQNRLGGVVGRVNGGASFVNEEEGTSMNSHHVD